MITAKPGDRFGAWTVISYTGKQQKYLCKCDCGTEQSIRIYDLVKGKSKMCKPCATSVAKRGHGQTTTAKTSSEYNSYLHMMQRCYNPKNKDYPKYGGRGIQVCDLWRDSFEAFYMCMGPKPEGYTIERIDYNGNYEPDNCRWASKEEQTKNKRDNVKVTINGVTKTVSDWARDPEVCSVTDQTIYKRIARGWDPVRAVTVPYAEKAKDK